PEEEKEEEEVLPLRLRERKDDKNKDAPRATIDLKVTNLFMRPVQVQGTEIKQMSKVQFRPGTPPLAVAEFYIDAASLARAAGIDLRTDPRAAGKRPLEIEEDDEDSALRFVARVPFHEKETRVFKDGKEIKEHVSERSSTQIIKRPLRVLLFASAA